MANSPQEVKNGNEEPSQESIATFQEKMRSWWLGLTVRDGEKLGSQYILKAEPLAVFTEQMWGIRGVKSGLTPRIWG